MTSGGFVSEPRHASFTSWLSSINAFLRGNRVPFAIYRPSRTIVAPDKEEGRRIVAHPSAGPRMSHARGRRNDRGRLLNAAKPAGAGKAGDRRIGRDIKRDTYSSKTESRAPRLFALGSARDLKQFTYNSAVSACKLADETWTNSQSARLDGRFHCQGKHKGDAHPSRCSCS